MDKKAAKFQFSWTIYNILYTADAYNCIYKL